MAIRHPWKRHRGISRNPPPLPRQRDFDPKFRASRLSFVGKRPMRLGMTFKPNQTHILAWMSCCTSPVAAQNPGLLASGIGSLVTNGPSSLWYVLPNVSDLFPLSNHCLTDADNGMSPLGYTEIERVLILQGHWRHGKCAVIQ